MMVLRLGGLLTAMNILQRTPRCINLMFYVDGVQAISSCAPMIFVSKSLTQYPANVNSAHFQFLQDKLCVWVYS